MDRTPKRHTGPTRRTTAKARTAPYNIGVTAWCPAGHIAVLIIPKGELLTCLCCGEFGVLDCPMDGCDQTATMLAPEDQPIVFCVIDRADA